MKTLYQIHIDNMEMLRVILFSTEISPQIYNPLSIFSVPVGALHINRNGFLNLDSLHIYMIFDFISQKVWNSISEAFRFYKRPIVKLVKSF